MWAGRKNKIIEINCSSRLISERGIELRILNQYIEKNCSYQAINICEVFYYSYEVIYNMHYLWQEIKQKCEHWSDSFELSCIANK